PRRPRSGDPVRALHGRVRSAREALVRPGSPRAHHTALAPRAARGTRTRTTRLPVMRGAGLRLAIHMLALLAVAQAQAADVRTTHRTLQTPDGRTIEADQGELHVPENRAKAGSRSIDIGFIRYRARTQAPRAPLFFLQGGPGSTAVSTAPGVLKF